MPTFNYDWKFIRNDWLNEVVQVAHVDTCIVFCDRLHEESIALRSKELKQANYLLIYK